MPDYINVRLVLSGLGSIISREVPMGTTLGELASLVEGWNFNTDSEKVRVNGTEEGASYVLKANDSVSVAPKNVKAAR